MATNNPKTNQTTINATTQRSIKRKRHQERTPLPTHSYFKNRYCIHIETETRERERDEEDDEEEE